MNDCRYIIETANGSDMVVWAQKIKGNLWIHYRGETFMIENEGEGKVNSSAKAQLDPLKIKSPMPGKVTSLKVNLGDVLDEGKVALVMEAMKMEYSLSVSKKSKVKSINVKVGDIVSLGDTLIELEDIV